MGEKMVNYLDLIENWKCCPLCRMGKYIETTGLGGNYLKCKICGAEWEVHLRLWGKPKWIKLHKPRADRVGAELVGIEHTFDWWEKKIDDDLAEEIRRLKADEWKKSCPALKDAQVITKYIGLIGGASIEKVCTERLGVLERLGAFVGGQFGFFGGVFVPPQVPRSANIPLPGILAITSNGLAFVEREIVEFPVIHYTGNYRLRELIPYADITQVEIGEQEVIFGDIRLPLFRGLVMGVMANCPEAIPEDMRDEAGKAVIVKTKNREYLFTPSLPVDIRLSGVLTLFLAPLTELRLWGDVFTYGRPSEIQKVILGYVERFTERGEAGKRGSRGRSP